MTDRGNPYADVYFKRPYHDEALGRSFGSRSDKAAYLKSRGLVEAGDHRHPAEERRKATEARQQRSERTLDRILQSVARSGLGEAAVNELRRRRT